LKQRRFEVIQSAIALRALQARNIFIELGGLEGYEQLGVISIQMVTEWV